MILRLIYKNYKEIRLKPNEPKNQFILQVFGFKEYIM